MTCCLQSISSVVGGLHNLGMDDEPPKKVSLTISESKASVAVARLMIGSS